MDIQGALSDARQDHDLMILEENVAAGVVDAATAAPGSAPGLEPAEIASYVRGRYEALWSELHREEELDWTEGWRIQRRIQVLQDLGFSVREVTIGRVEDGGRLWFKPVVADRNAHRDRLRSLTGLDVEEQLARILLREIQEHRIRLVAEERRDVSLAAAAFHWQLEIYRPVLARLGATLMEPPAAAALYARVLEHKWYLSEAARRDVGHATAADDHLATNRGRTAGRP